MLIVQVARTFAVAVVLVLTATGLWGAGADEEPAAAAEKEMVLDPTTGEMVEAPQYGGTLAYGLVSWGTNVDDWYGGAEASTGLVNEQLAMWDWGNDRTVWDWRIFAETPAWAIGGALAESWETPDDTTIIFNIRRGVHWHDKAPMNGREPGLFLTVTVYCLNMFGDAVRDLLDPRLRGGEGSYGAATRKQQ